jgi:hypothetical protein
MQTGGCPAEPVGERTPDPGRPAVGPTMPQAFRAVTKNPGVAPLPMRVVSRVPPPPKP